MSDLMLHGVLNMPLPDDPSEMGVVEWAQFRSRVKEALAKLAEVKAERDEWKRLQVETREQRDALATEQDCIWEAIGLENRKHLALSEQVSSLLNEKEAAETALPAVYRLGYADAKEGRITDILLTEPTPTAAELTARIKETGQ